MQTTVNNYHWYLSRPPSWTTVLTGFHFCVLHFTTFCYISTGRLGTMILKKTYIITKLMAT